MVIFLHVIIFYFKSIGLNYTFDYFLLYKAVSFRRNMTHFQKNDILLYKAVVFPRYVLAPWQTPEFLKEGLSYCSLILSMKKSSCTVPRFPI